MQNSLWLRVARRYQANPAKIVLTRWLAIGGLVFVPWRKLEAKNIEGALPVCP